MRKCALLLGSLALPALVACSSGDGTPSFPTRDAGGAPLLGGGVGIGGSLFADASCVSSVSRAESLPFDVYVLFDQSGSMITRAGSGTRLDAVRSALADFLRAPASRGIGVGLGYFGNFPLGDASCDPGDYEEPAVPVTQLPGATDALLGSLAGIAPTGETPTGPAIRGACTYMKQWKAAHPSRPLVMLLLTDGVPEAPISRENGCDPTLADAVLAAKQCAEEASSRVYVLGVGPNLDNLNEIAAAGETQAAHLVSGSDVSGEVLAALNVIRGTVLPCSFEIPAPPDGATLDHGMVNVVVTDDEGSEQAIYSVPGSSDCDPSLGGWYYAPSSEAPESIELCAASCELTRAQSAAGAIRFALGCSTLSEIR